MKLALAYTALLAYLPFALYLFKRLQRPHAAALSVVVGSMFLPEQVAIDLPMVPPMNKEYVTYLSTLIAAFVYRRKVLLGAGPGRGLEVAVFLMMAANVATAMKNPDPLLDEGRLEDGLGLYWIMAQSMDDVLLIGVPFFVGRALFRSIEDLYTLLGTLVTIGTLYTALILVETVMSIPFSVWQLSQVIFGLPARVNVRWGFTQPVVFFDNGLALATFMGGALIAAAGLAKAGLPLPRVIQRVRLSSSRRARNLLTAGLLMTLNVAGITYGLAMLVAHLFTRPRVIAAIAMSLTTLACVYPALRMADLFPHQAIVDFAANYDAERARSLGGRFDEEEHVLGYIGDRLWVGWGNISRTPGAETFGEGEAGLDGWWTIRLGAAGIMGVVLYYMMFAIPVLRSWRHTRRGNAGAILIGAVMCMISVRMVDLIINGWWNCFPVFMAGVLAGVTRRLR